VFFLLLATGKEKKTFGYAIKPLAGYTRLYVVVLAGHAFVVAASWSAITE
jgi:hypothetical protein